MTKRTNNKSQSQTPITAPESPTKSTASSITAIFIQKGLKERGVEIPSLKIKIDKQDKKE